MDTASILPWDFVDRPLFCVGQCPPAIRFNYVHGTNPSVLKGSSLEFGCLSPSWESEAIGLSLTFPANACKIQCHDVWQWRFAAWGSLRQNWANRLETGFENLR